MPIEIKELHITATVNSDEQPAAGAPPTANLAEVKEKIIAECVEQVLQVLRDREEP